MKRLVLLLFIALCLAVASHPLAAPDVQTERDIQGVRDTFAAMQQAYAAKDINLFLGLHEPLLPSFDGPRDSMIIYLEDQMREEITALFAMPVEFRMDFLELEILVDRGVATAKALRRGVASGLPVIYCRMAFTLSKENNGWGNQRWRFASYIIFDEWYDFAEDPNGGPGIQGFATTPRTGKRKSVFF